MVLRSILYPQDYIPSSHTRIYTPVSPRRGGLGMVGTIDYPTRPGLMFVGEPRNDWCPFGFPFTTSKKGRPQKGHTRKEVVPTVAETW